MSLKIDEFNFNSTFKSILNNAPSGIKKRCLIPDVAALFKSSDAILFAANTFNTCFVGRVFLSVKIPFGSRDKRVEIVYESQSKGYYLIKCCVYNNFDRDAIELQSFVEEIQNYENNINVRGLMLLVGSTRSFDLTKDFFASNAPMVSSSSISDLKNLEVLVGLLDKPKRSI